MFGNVALGPSMQHWVVATHPVPSDLHVMKLPVLKRMP
jgi:hypothetical protein